MKLQFRVKHLANILSSRKKVVIADYCTVKESAKVLDISPTGVYYRIMARKLPAIRFGKQLFIRKEDLK